MQLQQYRQNCFEQSGYLAATPTQAPLQVGDFAQVEQGEVKVLGNLRGVNFPNEIIVAETLISPKQIPWVLMQGVDHQQKLQQSDRLSGEHSNLTNWQKHSYQFKNPQSYIFHGKEGLCERIANWHEISDEVTLRLTQSQYSFRHVMVITDILKFTQWGLAIAATNHGQLDLAIQQDNQVSSFDTHMALSHQQSITQNSRNMYFVGAGDAEQHLFYRAKMLTLSAKLQDQTRNSIMENQQLTPTMRANWLTGDLINLLSANSISINNCMDSFTWADVTPDNIG